MHADTCGSVSIDKTTRAASCAKQDRKQRGGFLHNRSEFTEFPRECAHSPAKRNIACLAYVALPQGVLAFSRGCFEMQTQPSKLPQNLGMLCCTLRRYEKPLTAYNLPTTTLSSGP